MDASVAVLRAFGEWMFGALAQAFQQELNTMVSQDALGICLWILQ
jgi:hypothetical protein